MATFIDDSLRDAALAELDNVTHLHITVGVVTAYAGLAAATAGNYVGPTVGAVADGSPNGRSRTVAAIVSGDPGDVTADTDPNDVDHWCLVDETNDVVLASGELTNDQIVYNGNTFTLTAFAIRLPDQS